jgi:hypothetical protein
MQHWILDCQKCHQKFKHSDVEAPFFGRLELVYPPKPEFPKRGRRLQCPRCGKVSVYRRFQLTLQSQE